MGRREKLIDRFQTRHGELLETLAAGGHELHFFVIEGQPPSVKVGCTTCSEEWRGKRAQRKGRGLTPDRPCAGPVSG